MSRQLNARYMSCIIRTDRVTGLAAVYLTGPRFGVSVRDERLLGDDGWIDEDAPDRYADDARNYRGWTQPGALYCDKCWALIPGMPRDIIQANRCPECGQELYQNDDEFFDKVGFEVYRDKCQRYMQIAVYYFRDLIDGGAEHIKKNGDVTTGFHKDHMFSVRDGFEQSAAEHIVSSPVNIAVVSGRRNLSKGRKSLCTLAELEARYEEFEVAHPEWMDRITTSDAKQLTFAYEE